MGTDLVREDEEEFIIKKLFGRSRTEMRMQYGARRYGYNPSEDTHEPPRLLPQPFNDLYWRAAQKKGMDSGRPRPP